MSGARVDWRLGAWEERADIYDLFIEDRKADIGFYRRVCLEEGSPVLEMGCGSGRLLAAIAEGGLNCTGVDFSPRMLERCRRRIAGMSQAIRERVTLIEADVSTAPLAPETYAVAFMAFGMLGFLIKDGEAAKAIDAVARALKPGGALIVERRNRFADHYHTAREFDWIKKWRERDAVVAQSHTDVMVDEVKQIRETRYFYEGFEGSGELIAFQQVLYFREFSSLDVEEMIHNSGLSVASWYGDYDGRPFAPDQPRLIVVARKS